MMVTQTKKHVKKRRAVRTGRPLRGEPSRASIVMEAATTTFLRDGYGAASIDGIAAEARVSKATLYRHFHDKKALFEAVVTDIVAALVDPAELEAILARQPKAALKGFAEVTLDALSTPDALGLVRLMISESGRFPEIGAVFYQRVMGKVLQRLTAYLAEQTKKGTFKVADPQLAAFQFLGLLKEATIWPTLMGAVGNVRLADRKTVIDSAVKIFLGAIDPTYVGPRSHAGGRASLPRRSLPLKS